MPQEYISKEEEAKYRKGGFGNEIGFGSRPALLIIDFLYGFTDPESPFGANMDKEVVATTQLLKVARQKKIPVIYLVLYYEEGCESELGIWAKKMTALPMLKAGTRLVQIDDRVKPIKGEPVIVKKGPSAFFGTHLVSLLTHLQVDTLIITGCTTSGCVRATVVDALQYNFRPVVPRQCVADRAKAPHEANLFDINQKYGDVVPLQDVLDYLSGRVSKR